MRRAFSYVDDVVEVIADSLLPKYANITLNVGSEKDISIKELSDIIQWITGIEGKVEMVPARKQEISMFLADHTTQRKLYHYKETSIDKGLKTTWEWVKKQPLLPIMNKPEEIYV